MARYPSPSPRSIAFQFGPGPMTPAVKLLIWANVACFVGAWLLQVGFGVSVLGLLGLRPESVLSGFWVWQPVSYMFLHGGFFHILFNMLALWMFGVELERLWGRSSSCSTTS